jgi:hypothetical protein
VLPIYRVDGDAAPAYTGALSKALRTIWYAPDNGWVVIHDQLAAPTSHHFEFNLHAMAPFYRSDSGYRVDFKEVSACVDVLSPEVFTDGIIAAGLPIAPQVQKPPPSYSLQIPTTYSIKVADLWIAVRIGCSGGPLTLIRSPGAGALLSDGMNTFGLL